MRKYKIAMLILSDLNMPGKNGYDILSEMQSDDKYAAIKVVITSTSSIKSVRDKCLELGAFDFIPKPETFIDYSSFVTELYTRVENTAI
ncbi:response regulator [Dyadobacter sp. CY312]|uniref:response regulator n=1 Tax=Dyadobacter sp. CY312 TaxID=2907303 RepID=UPI001F25C074|nr:response regulator [Dyadobacter sp. CY312]MCE7042494.1 response regulator [Dyadobacter sp. CY312]